MSSHAKCENAAFRTNESRLERNQIQPSRR